LIAGMKKDSNGNGSKRHGSQQSVNGAVKSICDIMRRSNCAGALRT
jgi:type I restriction enzyme M protein